MEKLHNVRDLMAFIKKQTANPIRMIFMITNANPFESADGCMQTRRLLRSNTLDNLEGYRQISMSMTGTQDDHKQSQTFSFPLTVIVAAADHIWNTNRF